VIVVYGNQQERRKRDSASSAFVYQEKQKSTMPNWIDFTPDLNDQAFCARLFCWPCQCGVALTNAVINCDVDGCFKVVFCCPVRFFAWLLLLLLLRQRASSHGHGGILAVPGFDSNQRAVLVCHCSLFLPLTNVYSSLFPCFVGPTIHVPIYNIYYDYAVPHLLRLVSDQSGTGADGPAPGTGRDPVPARVRDGKEETRSPQQRSDPLKETIFVVMNVAQAPGREIRLCTKFTAGGPIPR